MTKEEVEYALHPPEGYEAWKPEWCAALCRAFLAQHARIEKLEAVAEAADNLWMEEPKHSKSAMKDWDRLILALNALPSRPGKGEV